MEFEQKAIIEQKPNNPWQRCPLGNLYQKWSAREQQQEFIRLSDELAQEYIDWEELICMDYVLQRWDIKYPTSEEKSLHALLFKERKLACLEQLILHPFLLQSEILK
jgi:hypothetical protein